jgi:hypothetical protein
VIEILAAMDPVDFWGRADRPFYGGAVGTSATLHLLSELGVQRTSALEAACENLLEHGQHRSGGFTYDGTPGRILLCCTGTAIRTLVHFGYRHDARVRRAVEYLVERSAAPDGLTCRYADHCDCQWGIVKALAGFASLLNDGPDANHAPAVQRLADALLDYQFDFEGRDARWLKFGFPLDYQSDLVELCDVLARLGFGADDRFTHLMQIVREARRPDGRWMKQYGTRALRVERQGDPSKWITLRALRAQHHAQITLTRTERPRLRGEPEAIDWEKLISES